MGLVRVGAPDAEPITLAEAKAHCRVDADITTDDALLTALISAAREQAEHRMQRSLVRQQWQLTLDSFPDAIRLRMPTVLAVDSVQYMDVNGAQQTLSSASYQLDNKSDIENWLVPAAGYAWPATQDQINAVTVTYRAGFGAAASDVPASIKAWTKLAVSTMYTNREAVSERGAAELPRDFVDGLLDPWRVWEV